MKPLEKEEKKLLDNWSRESEHEGFCRDGIVDHEKWELSKHKIVFLLKETNGQLESLPDYLNNTENNIRNFGATWFNIARWSYGIQYLEEAKDIKWTEIDGLRDKNLVEYLKYICAINLKKTPGKGASTNQEILDGVNKDGHKTFKQIQMYNSELLILCGTGDYFKEYINPNKKNWNRTTRGIWYLQQNNGTYVVWYYHPGAHFPKHFLYYNLLDALKEIHDKQRTI